MASKSSATATASTSRKVGSFEVEHELGRGGMGVIYLGWQPALERRVVLKALRRGVVDDPKLEERFRREAQAARRPGMAEREGFEPPRRSRALRFSRPVPSTARPPLRGGDRRLTGGQAHPSDLDSPIRGSRCVHLGLRLSRSARTHPPTAARPSTLGARCSLGLIVAVSVPQGSVVAIAAGRRRTVA